eukprot:c5523_g1_i1 orf=132-1499(+)
MDIRARSCAIGSLNTLVWKSLHEHLKNNKKVRCVTNGGETLFSLNVRASTSGVNAQTQNSDLPRLLPKNKKKPFVAPPKRGGFLAKKGPKKPLEDLYSPPGNGMLVPELIPVAHAVFEARETLLQLVAKLMEVVPVKACMFCDQTHVGPIGHDLATCDGQGSDSRRSRHVWTNGCVYDVVSNLDAYHSYDRLKLYKHDKRFEMKRLPALVELCIQAGVELPEYPTMRRMDPVRVCGRKIIEADELYFTLPAELDFLHDEDLELGSTSKAPSWSSNLLLEREKSSFDSGSGVHNDEKIISSGRIVECGNEEPLLPRSEEAKQIAETALRIWEVMRCGAEKLMKKYSVRACGYCPEVHIGPRGHMVRLCGAFKHQWRQGQHGWQVAGIDDLIPPKYVWHVPDLENPRLLNKMKKFYGQTPAIVELCVQAGANIPTKYKGMMRVDVVAPTDIEVEKAV